MSAGTDAGHESVDAAGRGPRISIGMPIYNGAASLAGALQAVLDQTVTDLEIVISDNASKDATAAICKDFAARDQRIRYFRQPETTPPTDNFNFVLREARAPFFMWAAHDDLRSPDYVEKLLVPLERDGRAALAFGDLVELVDGVPYPYALDFETRGVSGLGRLAKTAMNPLHHLYGVWRTESLRTVPWLHAEWWHDLPLMMGACMVGDFIHVPGVTFEYKYNGHPFFSWQRRPGVAGRLYDLRRLLARLGDLCAVGWVCGVVVTRVAGPLYGVCAAVLAWAKVAGQIASYIRRGGVSPVPWS